ncbi:plastocyanin/azurin family copper-binding protein [Thalassotalea fusca]
MSQVHIVKLLSSNESGHPMVMEPGFIRISAGDTVKFIPSDITHNAQSIILPDGANSFTTELGEAQSITFPVEGAYLYKCTPHFALGMVGVIQVGNANNHDAFIREWEGIKENVVLNQSRVESLIKQIN